MKECRCRSRVVLLTQTQFHHRFPMPVAHKFTSTDLTSLEASLAANKSPRWNGRQFNSQINPVPSKSITEPVPHVVLRLPPTLLHLSLLSLQARPHRVLNVFPVLLSLLIDKIAQAGQVAVDGRRVKQLTLHHRRDLAERVRVDAHQYGKVIKVLRLDAARAVVFHHACKPVPPPVLAEDRLYHGFVCRLAARVQKARPDRDARGVDVSNLVS
jgi:hypothetical protein